MIIRRMIHTGNNKEIEDPAIPSISFFVLVIKRTDAWIRFSGETGRTAVTDGTGAPARTVPYLYILLTHIIT